LSAVQNPKQILLENGYSVHIKAGSYVGATDTVKCFSVFSFKHQFDEKNLIKYLKYFFLGKCQFLTDWDLVIALTSETAAKVLKTCFTEEKMIREELLMLPNQDAELHQCNICNFDILGTCISLRNFETKQKIRVHLNCLLTKCEKSVLKTHIVCLNNQEHLCEAKCLNSFQTLFENYFSKLPGLVISFLKIVFPTFYLDKLGNDAIVMPYSNQELPKVKTVILPVVIQSYWSICQLDVTSKTMTIFCLNNAQPSMKEHSKKYINAAYGQSFLTDVKVVKSKSLNSPWLNNDAALGCTYAILTIIHQGRALGEVNLNQPLVSPLTKSSSIAKILLDFAP
jgi:hypothetical protein